MADLAYLAAVCGVEGFETTCAANRQNALEVMLSYDPLAKTVRALMADQNQWDGNMEKLLESWARLPESKRKLSDDLPGLTPMLRSVGIQVSHRDSAQRRAEERLVLIERVEDKR
jgi:hypothetical protein